ncbi:MAG: hypothetical protein KBB37_07875 [Bacteroidia bacterium]|nr:hypothetical protein [Bacteroidia bacterium]MBP7261190.1 hypothetical protein [Bacteroidia bacterium]MBP9180594.1 hypothetical protein [Bacteroidia bacterium]MBP9724519.1 hypothetical protein [Bacteroidia bacterium]
MKTTIVIILLVVSSAVNAQVTKGRKMFTGNGNITYQETFKHTYFDVHPGVGFVVADNLVAGLTVDYILSSVKDINKDRVIGAGPMFRYYIGGGSVKVFPHAQFTYNSYRTQVYTLAVPFDSKDNHVAGYGGLGLAYFIGESASIEVLAGYSVNDYNYFDESALRVRFGCSIFFGGE